MIKTIDKFGTLYECINELQKHTKNMLFPDLGESDLKG